MNTFNFITLILSVLFIILLVRTFSQTSLKNLFHNAKNKEIINRKRKEHEERGEKAFIFESGNVVIYAKTQARAIYEFKLLKRNQKRLKNV